MVCPLRFIVLAVSAVVALVALAFAMREDEDDIKADDVGGGKMEGEKAKGSIDGKGQKVEQIENPIWKTATFGWDMMNGKFLLPQAVAEAVNYSVISGEGAESKVHIRQMRINHDGDQ